MQPVDLIKCDVDERNTKYSRVASARCAVDQQCSFLVPEYPSPVRADRPVFDLLNELGYEGHFFERSGAMRPMVSST